MKFSIVRTFRCRAAVVLSLLLLSAHGVHAAESRFAHSDSDTRMLHHIDLYDAGNSKITPDSDKPYSPLMTCGRCHDYEAISHGWHFNAFLGDSPDGRRGEPWIWTETRSGTQLPLSYRDWKGLFDPGDLGVSPWDMTHQFGGRIPGGGVAAGKSVTESTASEEPALPDEAAESDAEPASADRWPLSGVLEVDCMICHASPSVYDFNARRDEIEDENFAWAATAGMRLGEVDGSVSRIKDGSDPADESVQSKLPKVTYDARKFSPDGTVFMDLIRKPSNNACYQCHSQRTVDEHGIESRWVHDQDVHLQSGMQCTDCHRNGIDHAIVRGFEGESEQSADPEMHIVMDTLTCAGCHLGPDHDDESVSLIDTEIAARSGRLGSPMPLHEGLPPVHFEKLSCTACHSGPIPTDEAKRIMTSFAHGLGSKDHRTGQELPAMVAPVFAQGEDGKISPHRAIWPAFWGTLAEGQLTPVDPAKVYDMTRKTLRVRRGFVEEIVLPELSSSERKEVLGEERAKVDATELTDEENEKLASAQKKLGETTFNEKVAAALESIEAELGIETAVYVSSGFVYQASEDGKSIVKLADDAIKNREAVEMVSWPLAHNVRPAGWSLGVGGCLECHSEGSAIFDSTVQSVGPGPDQLAAVRMSEVRGTNPNQVLLWNQLFGGRKLFKFIIAASIGVLSISLLIGIGALASRLFSRNQTIV
ncbi:hypothetical protein [Novipirellula artificiosorum]|uniref:Doubled CXXCH motif n=1 Tax=Novipirellula artificiosorum TaxID=2528016 RepID=A0A5C6DZG3_9BACT|nr:hypothetical protein [Novipirellula artificiosorum]TWU42002.1 Doubled CXXCH motif [Novipirellula artificiosorum]